MNQSRYILFAVLILFVVAIIVLGIGKLKCKQAHTSDVVLIDYAGERNHTDSPMTGKKIFSAYCASCHAINVKVVGPPLVDITKRGPWDDSILLYEYIKNPKSLKNNEYVKNLRRGYEARHMGFPELSNKDVKDLINYINSANGPIY